MLSKNFFIINNTIVIADIRIKVTWQVVQIVMKIDSEPNFKLQDLRVHIINEIDQKSVEFYIRDTICVHSYCTFIKSEQCDKKSKQVYIVCIIGMCTNHFRLYNCAVVKQQSTNFFDRALYLLFTSKFDNYTSLYLSCLEINLYNKRAHEDLILSNSL